MTFCLDWAWQSAHSAWTLAADRGFFAEAGLDVQIDRGFGAGDTISKVAAGTYDIGFADTNLLLKFNHGNPGNQVTSVLVLYDASPDAAIFLKSSGITKPKDLEGRSVSVSAGSATHLLLPIFTRANQLDTSKISLLPVLTHIYESPAQRATAQLRYGADGGSLVRHLSSVGLLTPRTTLAHAVYIDDAEIEMLARSGTGVVHNPMSNLKPRNGIAPVGAFRRAGVRLALGCDNTSCGDCQNLFQAMKAYALFCTASEPGPAGSPELDAVMAATSGGAAAVGLGSEIGTIAPGMKADLTLISLDDFSWMPFNSAARQMVYAETGRGVDTVLVDGRIVLRGGRLTTVDENAFRAELTEIMAVVDADHAALVPRQIPALGPLWATSRRLAGLDVGVERMLGQVKPV